MIPNTSISKSDGNTGVVRPSIVGILAIIAASEKGTANQAAGFARPDLVLNDRGYGPASDVAAYHMSVAGNSVLMIRPTCSVAAANSAVTTTGGGTSVATATGTPLDDFDVLVTWVNPGTIGVAGITYTYSLDGGLTTSAVTALGTATSVTIPNSGVVVSLAAGTILAGQTTAFTTTGPKMNNADLTLALEALRVVNAPWEAVLVFSDADATMAATLDIWLAAREAEGKFRLGIMGTRRKTAGETEATFKTAMQTLVASSSTIRVTMATDAGDVASVIPGRGITQPRSPSMGLAARLMKIDPSVDAAYVSDGPLPGYRISDARNNPKWHDEALFPGLDDLRLTTLRSFDGREGVFITNPLLLSPGGSDYVYVQHARVMNLACERAFQLLSQRLSMGVRKNKKADPTTGAVYILEADAAELEAYVNSGVLDVTKNRVSDAAFILSRTDDLGSNAGATLTGEVQIQSLAYVKKFSIVSKFVRKITATAA